MNRNLIYAMFAAVLVRVIPALYGTVTGDVAYHLTYVMQFLNSPDTMHFYGSVKSLYHNTPVWIIIETVTFLVSQSIGIPFAVLIKVWPVLADIGILAVVYKWFSYDQKKAERAAWFYALNPVSILVTGFHGQFDPVVIFFTVLALFLLLKGPDVTVNARYAAYLFLGVAIALKNYPVLLAPFFIIHAKRKNETFAGILLIFFPAVAASLPFAVADTRNFLEAVFTYSGSVDFGTGGIGKFAVWMFNDFHPLIPMPDFPPWFMNSMKLIYLSFWLYLVVRFARKEENITNFSIAVFAGFLAIYPGVSAQYLFWTVPFLILAENKYLWRYSVAASLCMIFFYLTYFPRILLGNMSLVNPPLWIPFVSAVLYLSLNGVLLLVTVVCLRDLILGKQESRPLEDISFAK